MAVNIKKQQQINTSKVKNATLLHVVYSLHQDDSITKLILLSIFSVVKFQCCSFAGLADLHNDDWGEKLSKHEIEPSSSVRFLCYRTVC